MIPQQMMIQTINFCQLNCKNCYLEYNKLDSELMDFVTFKNIIDKLDDVKNIHLTPIVGEPTLHSDIIKQLDYLKLKNKEVSMFTNLLNFDERFLKYDNLNLIVSIYGFNTYTYNTFTKSKMFDKFKENFNLLYKNFNKFKSIEFFIRNELLHMSEIYKQIKLMTKLRVYDYDKKTGIHIVENLWNGNWCDNMEVTNMRVNKKEGICSYAPINNSIDLNGDIILCGACDIKRETKIGNIFKNSLKTIYNDYNIIYKIYKNMEQNIYTNTCCEKCSEFHI